MTLQDQIKLLETEVAVAWLDCQRGMVNDGGRWMTTTIARRFSSAVEALTEAKLRDEMERNLAREER